VFDSLLDLSIPKLLEKLAQAGIPRERAWVVKVKAEKARKSLQ
jgi:hypothetical protein